MNMAGSLQSSSDANIVTNTLDEGGGGGGGGGGDANV